MKHLRDSVGLDLSGTDAGVSAVDDALLALLRFQPEVGHKIGNIVKTDPSCPMGYLLSAYLGLLSTERPDGLAAADQLGVLDQAGLKLNERERMHLKAARSWASGDMRSAAGILDEVTAIYPTDTLALYVGHQLDFFTGSSQHLNDRIAAALPKWDNSHLHYGYLSGMWAFGLEESGNYSKAEEIGRRAVEINRNDVWAIHAVTHVMEMTGRVDDGLGYLTERQNDWMSGNFLNVHNTWHKALFLLECEKYSDALALYDSFIHNADSPNLAMEMLDASALLWRLHLDEIEVGNRWQLLADCWAAKDPESWYFFNDMHAAFAFVGSGRIDEAEAIISRLQAYVAQSDSHANNREIVAQVGIPITRAIVAHGKGDYVGCAGLLDPIRNQLRTIGGSHAQRDALERTFIDALQRSGSQSRADQLLHQRLVDRPANVWSSIRLARSRPID